MIGDFEEWIMSQEITQEDVEKWLRDNPDLKAVNTTGNTTIPPAEIARHLPVAITSESEAAFQQRVIKLLQDNGWKVLATGAARIRKGGKDTYVTPYRADGKGFPDCFAVHPSGKMLSLELKSNQGKASPEQVEWLLVLSKCGVITHVVTPDNWPQIQKTIREATHEHY